MSAVGVAFKSFRRSFFLHPSLEYLNKLISYANGGAPIPILKALNERRGSRFQRLSEQKLFARYVGVSEQI